LINTGSTGALSVNGPFNSRNKLLEHLPDTRAITYGALLAGRSSGRIGRVNRLRIGEIGIDNVIANVSQDVSGDDADAEAAGMIGSEILKRFKLIVDYSRKRVIFERNLRFSEPYEFDMSGASLAAGGVGFKTFKVRTLIEDSPATDAGLTVGDIVTSINGTPAASMTLEQIRKMFRRPGQRFVLKILRSEKLLELSLKTRRII
jgi:C-terminal processing protease CtpA/Prc